MSTSAVRRSDMEIVALKWVGNIAGPFTLFLFGIALALKGASENLLTFSAWGVLDFLSGVSMFYAGARKESLLPLAYGIICVFVVAMIYKNAQWQWTIVEWVCLIGVIVSIIGWWLTKQPLFGVISSAAAATIASIPLIVGNYHEPQTWEWFLWVGSLISASIGLYLTYPWRLKNIGEWLFVGVSEVLTIIILVLILRPLFF